MSDRPCPYYFFLPPTSHPTKQRLKRSGLQMLSLALSLSLSFSALVFCATSCLVHDPRHPAPQPDFIPSTRLLSPSPFRRDFVRDVGHVMPRIHSLSTNVPSVRKRRLVSRGLAGALPVTLGHECVHSLLEHPETDKPPKCLLCHTLSWRYQLPRSS